MAYIGKEPQVGNYSVLDSLTASSTNSYTMQLGSTNFIPESANHLIVSLNGVIQKPGSSFTVSGSTITFILSSGTLSSSDSIDFIIALGNVLDIGVPSDDTVGAAQIKDDLISGTTALAVAPADTDEFLVSDAGTLKRIDYSLIKASNTPAFQAVRTSNQSIANTTYTKVQFDTENFDTNSTYDKDTNYRFTPGVAGKYYIYTQVRMAGLSADSFYANIYKNGSEWLDIRNGSDTTGEYTLTGAAAVTADTDDYYEVFVYQNSGGALNVNGYSDAAVRIYTSFGAYKIIT